MNDVVVEFGSECIWISSGIGIFFDEEVGFGVVFFKLVYIVCGCIIFVWFVR